MVRVLIVDDELLVAETLRWVFEKNGFATCAVNSADAALQRVKSFVPDLVLCDLQMPEKDGGVLIAEIGRLLPGCPILVLTGTAGGELLVQDLTEAGRRISMLRKPCPPLELLRVAGCLLAA